LIEENGDMQNQIKRHRRRSKPQRKLMRDRPFFQRAFAAFCQLSEPAQTVLIVGLLLLLFWLITHPLLLATLIKALLGMIATWVTLKQV